MPRVVVTAEHAERGSAAVLLDEQVHAVHLSTEHSAKQLIERLGWAITDAEVGGDQAQPRPAAHPQMRTPLAPLKGRRRRYHR